MPRPPLFSYREELVKISRVHFIRDEEPKIKALAANGKVTDGAIYVATDTGTMWLGTSSTALLQIKDNIDTDTTYTLDKSGSTIQLKDQSGSVVSTIDDSDTTYSNFTGATASAAGKAGLVPAPPKGFNGCYLNGSGSWNYISSIAQKIIHPKNATESEWHPILGASTTLKPGTTISSSLSSVNGGMNFTENVCIQPVTGSIAAKKFVGDLTGNADTASSIPWSGVTDKKDMTGATASTDGTNGLVPAPSAGQQNHFLRGDGTWKEVSVSSNWDSVTNKPTFAAVATSGSYEDLTNKPTIPVVPEAIKNPNALTISLNGTSQGAYDGSDAKSIDITPASIGAATSSHNHDSSYYTKTQVDSKINEVIAVQSTQPTSSNCKLWIKI